MESYVSIVNNIWYSVNAEPAKIIYRNFILFNFDYIKDDIEHA